MSEPTPAADTPPAPESATLPVTPSAASARARSAWSLAFGLMLGVGIPLAIVVAAGAASRTPDEKKADDKDKKDDPPAPDEKKKVAAPELDGGLAWLNTGGPVSLKKDLKGKIVILDFWTLCCINCIHNLPDLAKLEKKYPNELVVIGVHSPKFDSEKETNSIRKAVLRYQIEHPVVNDADHKIWDRYDVDAWPTLVVIDPEGNLVGYTSGEGNFEVLDKVVEKLIEKHKANKTLDQKPIRFDLAQFRETGDTPLFFPGKVLADPKGKRVFIADSTHHRVVVTDLDGKFIAAAGTGRPGNADGDFATAEFHDPQGLEVAGDILYVADRKNHSIRELDLKAKTVRTIAGTGEQEGDVTNRRLDKPVPARSIGLNSPWDLCLVGETLYVAMAGHHQIWAFDTKKRDIGPYAGSGRENIGDGPLPFAMFAQPSGLTSDGKNLYVADSEISALRKVPLGGLGRVQTLVGRGLFTFGDKDGPGQDGGEGSATEARMQHALGVAYNDGSVYVADTYNNKIKVYDIMAGKLKTLVGGDWGWIAPSPFNEPAGISYADGKLYVADTNAHRIRVVDLKTTAISTLQLQGVKPPELPKEPEPKK